MTQSLNVCLTTGSKGSKQAAENFSGHSARFSQLFFYKKDLHNCLCRWWTVMIWLLCEYLGRPILNVYLVVMAILAKRSVPYVVYNKIDITSGGGDIFRWLNIFFFFWGWTKIVLMCINPYRGLYYFFVAL